MVPVLGAEPLPPNSDCVMLEMADRKPGAGVRRRPPASRSSPPNSPSGHAWRFSASWVCGSVKDERVD